MNAEAIARAIVRSEAVSFPLFMLGDRGIERRLGLAVARVAGLVCLSSREMPGALFTRALGYGTLVAPTQRAIDAVVRHYERLGLPARVELPSSASRSAIRLLERSGFRREEGALRVHVHEPRRPRPLPEVAELRIRPVGRTAGDATAYAKLATRGFGGKGIVSLVFERGWIRQLTRGRRANAFVGEIAGRPAATGVLYVVRPAAGLYSGSVLPAFRGRGIQSAMIAARVRHGMARGLRLFFSMTQHNPPSERNLRDAGFRTRFEIHRYVRET